MSRHVPPRGGYLFSRRKVSPFFELTLNISRALASFHPVAVVDEMMTDSGLV